MLSNEIVADGALPKQQKFRAMNGAHLASPIRGELGYAQWPQLGSHIHCPIGNQIWGPLGKDDVCPNFALMVGKFVFSNSGNFRAKANSPKPRSCPKRPFGQYGCGPIPVLTMMPSGLSRPILKNLGF